MPEEHDGWESSWLYLPNRPVELVQVIWRKDNQRIIYDTWGESHGPIKTRRYRAAANEDELLKGPKGHTRRFKTFKAAEKAIENA